MFSFFQPQLFYYHFFLNLSLFGNSRGKIQDCSNECSTNSSNVLPNCLTYQYLVSRYIFLGSPISFMALLWLWKQLLIDFALLPKCMYSSTTTQIKRQGSIKSFSFMTCMVLTTLVNLVTRDAFRSNIFTHHIALNIAIITQCSDKKYATVINSANHEQQLLHFVFQTIVSKKS